MASQSGGAIGAGRHRTRSDLLPLAGASPTAPRLQQRCTMRLQVAALFMLLVVAYTAGPGLLHLSKNVWRHVFYTYDPMFLGRNDATFPAPHCCEGAACIPDPATARNLVLTYVRSDNYLPLLRQMECTFRKSNPGVELGVMTVKGELGPETTAWLASHNVTRFEVKPLRFPNKYNPRRDFLVDWRYGENWLKLRAWNLTQYSAVVLIDSDVAVVGSLAPLFLLPVEFAASWDQTKMTSRSNTRLKSGINGGVVLLRPCPAVQRHMLQLLDRHHKLHFTYGAAEQDFFTWYFRYDGLMLPVEYNTMASDSLLPNGKRTIGGRSPVVIHYTRNKPFHGPIPGKPGHGLLCSAKELAEQ